jgi:hypothetical protein
MGKTKLISIFNDLQDLYGKINDLFDGEPVFIKDSLYGLYLEVTTQTGFLAEGEFEYKIFQKLCDEESLSGNMIFNKDNTVTFTMMPKP